MKRSYVLYTTLFAVVVGVILCYVFVFSDEDIQSQIAATFEKIEIQTSHQATSMPPVEASPDEEDIDTTDALEQIQNIDEVYYSDTIGAYLVLTKDHDFFEVSGNANRVNASLKLETENQSFPLGDFIGMRMIAEDKIYAVTSTGVIVTIAREEGRWMERERKAIAGLVSTDRLFGLGYDKETERLIIMNRTAATPDIELIYVQERIMKAETPEEAEPATDEPTQSAEETIETDAVSPENEALQSEGTEETEDVEPLTEWTIESRKPLTTEGMSASIQQKFEKFRGVGLVERQGRIYVLDSEELVLYTVNPGEGTMNGQMVTPRVYGSTGMFLQDNEIFAIVRPDVFDLDAFVSVD
ncbi:hypothetical protein EVJ27_02490 [Exiguobacterium sp. SH3S2]|uniref:hypothetical protein n=1 Tax=unclassified Exiguobacterium TaxID=2644629 RepID=UPI00103F60E4|nr:MULTISPECIES: hypothetical protein [unclassified Exiguobacterium]TCI27790.1 hypothetical protein EVJ32_00870 [Exiguobacterium sp. SH5S4]TCI48852.1 hypothetical protein EVJ28_02485 [Exiguobacterium sp. SH3S3]TCI56101.1 hypothetical protein EVJ30_05420 [Exiguobacterium sp. SH5S13]TCI63716.1 hypothetical protein EVJ27_02490 [Exiguobacterium sp. SH3S2]TCI64838.1 hypothetical protein EVJ26_03495 [Exiguobacterium sp. SH3S1]